jgi:AraC family transcriptional regulator
MRRSNVKLCPFIPSESLRPLVSTDLLQVNLVSDPAGVVEFPGISRPRVAIHLVKPVWVECKLGDEKHSGLAVHGDICIIPCGIPSRWEAKQTDIGLVLSPTSKYLQQIAQQSGFDPTRLRLRTRFGIRDPQIEHTGWALMCEAEQDFPSGRLYLESLATALATRLVQSHSSVSDKRMLPNGGLPGRKLRQVLTYIEENLSEQLSLESVASMAGLSASHFKVLFGRSVGVPLHQYVIRCRVKRAEFLLRRGDLPVSQVAVEVGFCHQSHLALHMRRTLGVTPRDVGRKPEPVAVNS